MPHPVANPWPVESFITTRFRCSLLCASTDPVSLVWIVIPSLSLWTGRFWDDTSDQDRSSYAFRPRLAEAPR
jgi:hypothetical protein